MLLKTLGSLALEGAALRRPKPLLLLAYLVVEGARDRKFLSELFWPHAADPMASLRTAITQVRASAPGALDGDVMLRCTVPCDVQHLREALGHKQFKRVEALYLGPFLQGFYLKDLGRELEEWIYTSREALAAQVQSALLEAAEAHLAAGDSAEAVRLAESAYWLPNSPEPEEAIIHRAYRLLAAGNSTRINELRKDAREFGIVLNSEVALTSQAVQPATEPSLPQFSGTFVGREHELAEIPALLSQDDCRLLTLVGAGGIGKTTLALQVGHQLTTTQRHTVFFVDLAVLTAGEQVPVALAGALGVTLSGVSPVEELTRVLETQPAPLIVLDNFETVMPAVNMIGELLRRCPNVKMLVTSRERLDLGAEWVYRLGGPPVSSVTEVTRNSDAVQLFVQRARRALPGFRAEEQLLDILEICRLVGGSPLGIELAAAWAGDMTPQEIADEIMSNLDVLEREDRDANARHRSIRAIFTASWDMLRDEEQRTLRRLAAFRGSFSTDAARTVTEAMPNVLSSLVDRGLLQRDTSRRLSRHPLVVAYTDEKAKEYPDELESMYSRHAAYYAELASRKLEQAYGQRLSAILEIELDNLRDAWRWTASQDDEQRLLIFAALLDRLYTVTGRYGEAEAAFAYGVRHRQEGTLTWAKLMAFQGKYTPFLGQLKKGISLLKTSLAVFRRHECRADMAFALRHLGFVVYHDGRYEEAEELLREGLELARELDAPRSVAGCLSVLGNVVELLGKLDEAEAMHREALALYTESRDYGAVATSLVALGDVEVARNCFDLARKHYERSFNLRLESGNTGRAAGALARLGDVALATDDAEAAERLYRQALELALAVHGLPWVIEALLGLANVFARRGDTDRALDIAYSIRSESNTTHWYRERAQAVIERFIDADATDLSLTAGSVFEVAKALLG